MDWSCLSRVEFEGSLARKRPFHSFNSWTSKEASHESVVFMKQACDLNVRICTKHIVFNGASVAEKSWLACTTVAGVVALAGKCFRTGRAVELMVPGDFSSPLMMLCYYVLHLLRCCFSEEMRSLLQLLEFEGSLARKRPFHSFNSWNSKDASHESVVFTS